MNRKDIIFHRKDTGSHMSYYAMRLEHESLRVRELNESECIYTRRERKLLTRASAHANRSAHILRVLADRMERVR